MEIFKKLQAIDRRWIYLMVALAISIPLMIPFNSKVRITEPAENVYKMIDSFSGKSNKAILMCIDHDASTSPELMPMEVSILRHCFERNIKVFTICFNASSAPLVDYAINIAKENYTVVSGVDYCNFGYQPLFLPIILGMGEDIGEAVETDAEGRKVSQLPIMQDIKNYNDMNLVIEFSASSGAAAWITYARVKFGVNVAAGITAVMAADNYPYLQTGQLIGMLSGLKGAAEYEEMVDVFASYEDADYPNGRPYSRELTKNISVPLTTEKITYVISKDNGEKEEIVTGLNSDYRYKAARIGMNAQSVVHLLIIAFIILGNIGYFVTRKKDTQVK